MLIAVDAEEAVSFSLSSFGSGDGAGRAGARAELSEAAVPSESEAVAASISPSLKYSDLTSVRSRAKTASNE